MQRNSKTTYLRKIYKSYLGIFITFVTISILFGLFYINSAHADSTSVSASATVLESCSIESTNNDHVGTIVAGNYDQIGDDTVFSINCNDPNGYIIYAVGNSGDEEGNTDLIAINTGDNSSNNNIITGLNTEGDISNWSFKLSNPTENLTILSSFNDNSIIPTTRTAVVKREAGTTSPTVDSFHASYSAYVSKTQPVDTYQGKVKYILFHPSSTIVTYYTITYNTNGGTPDIETQSGNTTDSTITLSSTTPNKSNYEFQGWCSVQPTNNNSGSTSCPGDKYNPGASYQIAKGTNITLYAMYGLQTCNNTGVRLKDGKCWSKSDVATSVRWDNASSYCSGVWHLPALSEFAALMKAYYPSTDIDSSYRGSYRFNGDSSIITNDWGATNGTWWSSSQLESGHAYCMYIKDSAISTCGSFDLSDRVHYQVRCVSN